MKKIAISLFLLGATLVDASSFVSCTATSSCTVVTNGYTITYSYTATSQGDSDYACYIAKLVATTLVNDKCNQVNQQ